MYSLNNQKAYKCFDYENVPVDTDEIYESHCMDNQGNKFQENSTLTSCCQCLM